MWSRGPGAAELRETLGRRVWCRYRSVSLFDTILYFQFVFWCFVINIYLKTWVWFEFLLSLHWCGRGWWPGVVPSRRALPRGTSGSRGKVWPWGRSGFWGTIGGAEGMAHAGHGLGPCLVREGLVPMALVSLLQERGAGWTIPGAAAGAAAGRWPGGGWWLCAVTAGLGDGLCNPRSWGRCWVLPHGQLRLPPAGTAQVQGRGCGQSAGCTWDVSPGSGWIVQWGEAKRGKRGEEPAPLCCAERGTQAHPLPACSAPLERPEALLIVVCLFCSFPALPGGSALLPARRGWRESRRGERASRAELGTFSGKPLLNG